MCAFAILAMITGFVTSSFVENVDKATDALSRRELREAADTIFRKIIYEHQKYNDGDSRTLDAEYGDFAGLRGYQKDRWAIYKMELEKKQQTVVGTDPSGEDSLFAGQSGNEDTSSQDTSSQDTSSQDTSSQESPGGTGEGQAVQGYRLTRLTLKIFKTDEMSDQPLLTLTTWIDPGKEEGGAQ